MESNDESKTIFKSLSSDDQDNEKKHKNLKRGYSSMLHFKDHNDNSHYGYSLTDAFAFKQDTVKLPLASFNHIAREVFNLEKSKTFYVDILGFQVIPRPMFDSEGYWLYGYGLSLHLVATTVPDERKITKKARIKHFSTQLPRVDHIAFISHDIQAVKSILDRANVYYKHEITTVAGIEQLFFFDPDGNVLEVSNCAPEIGETVCKLNASSPVFTLDKQKDAIENIIKRESEANLEKLLSEKNSLMSSEKNSLMSSEKKSSMSSEKKSSIYSLQGSIKSCNIQTYDDDNMKL